MTVDKNQKFWNRIADRYAARPIKDTAAYEALLADAASRLQPGDKVLEIGCGTGGTAIHLAPAVASFTATDFSAEMIRIAQAKPAPDNLRFVVRNAEHAFDGGPFDAILALNVLHLVNDLPGILAGIHANLRPGGLLISKTWCFADMGLKLRLLFRVLRTFGMFPAANSLRIPQLQQAIDDAGFEVVDQRCFGAHRQNPYIVARKPAPATA
ncbi:class I SAM-dependent methyltransferase [Rhodobacter ferrooxidans]|uniref:Methyltransferase type 12 n=1 Tax=Rhodobacter ferrooxidans TaxID=371731 RepID=C8S4G2_9RHOB|nr:class I SAM-dependent methyltransferase [Rhodobacter sp. SW2]EEW24129.1 Methyltransferase type 12 [Rhodobacter sp. SW2]